MWYSFLLERRESTEGQSSVIMWFSSRCIVACFFRSLVFEPTRHIVSVRDHLSSLIRYVDMIENPPKQV